MAGRFDLKTFNPEAFGAYVGWCGATQTVTITVGAVDFYNHPLVGRWRMTGIEFDGEFETLEDMFGDFIDGCLEMIYVFRNNGWGYMAYFGERVFFSWSPTEGAVTLTANDFPGDPFNTKYEVYGDNLRLIYAEFDNEILHFERVN